MADQKTKEVLAALLKEPTGIHMLDSGGAYGRHWQRNQEREFEQERASNYTAQIIHPSAYYNYQTKEYEPRPPYLDMEFGVNLYHWLVSWLEVHDEWNRLFQDFIDHRDSDEFRYESWYETRDAFFEALKGHGFTIRDEGGNNSYNMENFLSQDIQWDEVYVDYAEKEDADPDADWQIPDWFYESVTSYDYLVFLQIHGGADIRGGYTEPMIFTPRDEGFGHNMADGSLVCRHCPANWWTDDTYHWYFDGSTRETLKFGDIDGPLVDTDCPERKPAKILATWKPHSPYQRALPDFGKQQPDWWTIERIVRFGKMAWRKGAQKAGWFVCDNKLVCPRCYSDVLQFVGGFNNDY